MNKAEYINALSRKLKDEPEDFRNEILDAFEEHFREGEENGLSDAEIIENLGTVDEVAENIRMMHTGEERNTSGESMDDLVNSVRNLRDTLQKTVEATGSVFGESMKFILRDTGEAVKTIIDETDAALKKETAPEYTDSEMKEITDTEHCDTLHLSIEKAPFAVKILPGDVFAYSYQPCTSLFSKKSSMLHADASGSSIDISITGTGTLNTEEGLLKLALPEHIQNIQISMPAGKAEIKRLEVNELNVSAADGDIKIEDSTAKSLRAVSTSGDIRLLSSTAETLTAKASSGDITFRSCTGNLAAESSSGNISITDHTAEAAVLRSSSGDIQIKGSVPIIDAVGASGDIDLKTDLISDISAETSSGDILAKLPKASCSALIKTGSGDVKSSHNIRRTSGRSWETGNSSYNTQLITASGDIFLKD